MKKLLVALVLAFSLVLMPHDVKAASYEDYFTIENYFISRDAGRALQIKLNTDQVSFTNDCALKGVKVDFQMEQVDGTYQTYAEGMDFYQTSSQDLIGSILETSDMGLNSDVVEANFRIVIHIAFENYTSMVTIDLSKAQLDENGKILNKEKCVVEGNNSGSGDSIEEGKGDTPVTLIDATTNSLAKDVFEEIKATGVEYTYEKRQDNHFIYSWIFNGAAMLSTDFNVNLNVNVGSSANQGAIESSLSNPEKALVLEFLHSGALPIGTKVAVNVENKFRDTSKLILYYYNPTTKKLEEVLRNLEVKNGIVEFDLVHCSDYVLVEEGENQIVESPVQGENTTTTEIKNPTTTVNKAPNNAQTSSLNETLYMGMVFVSLLGIVVLGKKSKKIA